MVAIRRSGVIGFTLAMLFTLGATGPASAAVTAGPPIVTEVGRDYRSVTYTVQITARSDEPRGYWRAFVFSVIAGYKTQRASPTCSTQACQRGELRQEQTFPDPADPSVYDNPQISLARPYGTTSETHMVHAEWEVSKPEGEAIGDSLYTYATSPSVGVVVSPRPCSHDGRVTNPEACGQPARSRPAAKLRAKPGGPYSGVERGAPVQLDGAGSTGNIRSYRWSFDNASCSNANPKAVKRHRRVKITPLCSLRATLTVSDGRKQDAKSVPITVKHLPRVPYKQTERGHEQARDYVFDEWIQTYGFNRGTPEWILNPVPEAAFLWLYPGDDLDGTKGSYDIAQVADPGGPWDKRWFVKSHRLGVDRTIIINRRLLPGGDVYRLNKKAGRLNDLAAVVESVRDHEQAHGRLARDALRETKDANPIPALEALILGDPAELRQRASLAIGSAECFLGQASLERNVKKSLRRKWGRRSATIALRKSDGTETTLRFPSIAEIGDDDRLIPSC